MIDRSVRWLVVATLSVFLQACGPNEKAVPHEKAAVSVSNSKLERKIGGPVKANNQDLSIMIDMVRGITKMAVQVDPDVSAKITCSLDDPTVRELLDVMLTPNGFTYSIVDENTIRVGRDKNVPGAASALNASTNRLSEIPGLKNRIDGPVVAKNQSIHSILSLLQSTGKIQFTLEEGLSANVSFSLTDPTVGDVLEAVLKQTGFECAAENAGIIMVRKPKTNK